jgi:hypothetical protein
MVNNLKVLDLAEYSNLKCKVQRVDNGVLFMYYDAKADTEFGEPLLGRLYPSIEYIDIEIRALEKAKILFLS